MGIPSWPVYILNFFFEFFFHQQFTNFQIILFSDESMDILKTFNYTAQYCGDPLPMAQQN